MGLVLSGYTVYGDCSLLGDSVLFGVSSVCGGIRYTVLLTALAHTTGVVLDSCKAVSGGSLRRGLAISPGIRYTG